MSARTDDRDRRLLVRAARFDRPFAIREVGDGPDYFPSARLLRELWRAGQLRRVNESGTLPVVYEWCEP